MFESWDQFWKLATDSEHIIRVGGLALVTLIVFAETGIFFLFFLPGDYLLFTAGLLCATNVLNVPYFLLAICLLIAAVLGNLFGFLFGRYLGHKFETMRESWFFKRRYLLQTQQAFDKYGGQALIVGRFLPVIRTFAPIIAGASHFSFWRFMALNMSGGALWVFGLTSIGYYLGYRFPQILNYVEYIIIAFIAVTTIILIRSVRKIKNEQSGQG